MTTFAKGLVSGTIQAPAKTSWWPRHARTLLEMLSFSEAKALADTPKPWTQLEAIAKEWEALCPSAAKHGLMLEHALLEVALIDAVRKNKTEDINTVGKQLFDNAAEIAAVLKIAIPHFPEQQFKKLLCDHVALYAGSVRKKMEGAKVGGADMELNTLSLADLTAEWL